MHRALPPLTLALSLALAGCGPSPRVLPGYLEADLLVVAPIASGTLARVAVQRGQHVQAGQLLFAMDADAEAHGAEAARARRERAQAREADLRQARRPHEIAALREQLRQAEAQLAGSEASWQRQQQLVDSGFVSAARQDELAAARTRDAARVGEAQALLAQAHEAARRHEIDAAAADSRAAGAEQALAGWRQAQSTRVAPAAGQVFDVLFRPGEVVGAGTPVLALLPDDGLKLRFFVPQHDLPQAQVGRSVHFDCDGCAPGLRATIRWVSPQAEFTPPVIYSANARAKLVYRVEAWPDVPRGLQPGQPVDVRWAPP